MSLVGQIERAREDPAALERLYRESAAVGDEASFREAISKSLSRHPGNLLLRAWGCRFDLEVSPATSAETAAEKPSGRHWWIATAASAILSVAFVLLAGDQMPYPIPGASIDPFWLGWAPVTAIGILLYLVVDGRIGKRWYCYVLGAVMALIVGGLAAWNGWGRTDQAAILISIHLPFAAWAAVGAGVSLGYRETARQLYGYVVKSVETVLTAGIYLAAGCILLGLTVGIFDALGVTIPNKVMQVGVSAGIGLIPILALASLYESSRPPTEQSWVTGLARLLKILTRLILGPALVILVIYLFWFVPVHFWRPFMEREVLIVYNATIMAIIANLACIVPDPGEKFSPRSGALLRYAVLATSCLTFLLNAYALAAVASRTVRGGITPNRHAVLGWNVITLIILAHLVIRLVRAKPDQWPDVFRRSVALSVVPAIGWALWVVLGLPLL
jgi:hypothetical protein